MVTVVWFLGPAMLINLFFLLESVAILAFPSSVSGLIAIKLTRNHEVRHLYILAVLPSCH